jgi:ribosome maturation factor RimP
MVAVGTEQQFEPFLVPFEGSEEVLRSILEPALSALGLELVQLHHVHGSNRDQVRIFVDKAEGGIQMADLERANRIVGDVLDVEDQQRKLFSQRYDLEVSSPGLDRPLTKRSHFARAAGQTVKVKLKQPQDGQRTFSGPLLTTDEGISVDGRAIRYDEIQQANVVFQFETPQKPQKKQKKARK